MVLCPHELQRNSTSLHVTSKQNHFTYITSFHSTFLHCSSLHLFTLNPNWIPSLVTTFLTLFLKVFSLQRKDPSKPADNWFQLLMVLFTKEYLPTYVLFFLALINAHYIPHPRNHLDHFTIWPVGKSRPSIYSLQILSCVMLFARALVSKHVQFKMHVQFCTFPDPVTFFV
jgi:hypothetical protein